MDRYPLGKKINYVIDVVMDGCDAPLTVIAQTAFPAAMRAVATYYCPDPVQMFTGYVRPGSPLKGKRKGDHGRGTRSDSKKKTIWSRFKKIYGFDPSEWAAKKMPFADEMEGREVPGGARYGWAFFGAIERFNNWMFMYELTENFFYEWAAGVAATEYCQHQRSASFFGRSEQQGHFALLDATPCVISEVLKIRKVSYSGGNGLTPQVRRFQAMMSVGRISPWAPGQDISQCELIIQVSGQPPTVQKLQGDGTAQASFAMSQDGGSVFFYLAGPFSYFAYDVEFSVFGYEDLPEPRPADWCAKLADRAMNWADGT